MERDFRYLREKYTDPGAREVFQKICTSILQDKYGELAHEIRVSQGDDGIDIYIGDFSEPGIVFQCKFFIDGIGESQKKQIRESYSRAKGSENFTMKKWVLCLPCQLSVPEFKWWSSWNTRMKLTDQIEIGLYEGNYLLNELKKIGQYDSFFDEEMRRVLEGIQESLHTQSDHILSEILSNLLEDDADIYDGMVFVNKLECANIREINGCKNDYFNAELALQSILSKNDETLLRVYNQLKLKIFSFWQNQYRLYQDEIDGNELLGKTYERIEDNDTTTLQSVSSVNLLAKKGILHQLAEECSVGWVKEYQTRLEEYLSRKMEMKVKG